MEHRESSEQPRPRVGIGVLIQNHQGRVLLGLRKGSHGAGEWSLPGGHLEFGETIFESARREVKEETDLTVTSLELISVADEMRYIKTNHKHYLNLGLKATVDDGEPKVMEPNKCEEWRWLDLDNLPEKMLEGTELTIRNFKNHTIYLPEPL